MYINNQPFTNFKGINVSEGVVRIANSTIGTTDYGLVLKTVPGLTSGAERKIYAKDGSGSMVVKGYHIVYGSTSIVCSSNIAANGVATTSVSISGVLTTSYILINAATTAESASFVPFGATCQTAGKVIVQYYVGAATSAVTVVPITYAILNPQTS
jgi:hypothetical protein